MTRILRLIAVALCLWSAALFPALAAAPIYVNPTGGEDGPNIQAAMNAGAGGVAVNLCGVYHVGIDMTLVRNVAGVGCGPNACLIIATKPGGIVFGYNFAPGMQLAPGFFTFTGCAFDLQGIAAAAFSIWSFGDYHDPGQTIYGIRLKDLQILNATAVAVQIGRSMGTTLDDVYVQGGVDAAYCFDCGELHVHNFRAENGSGVTFRRWGTGMADDHWCEGGHFDGVIGNGMGYGFWEESCGWDTATHLDITTMTKGPALWLRGSVRGFDITSSQFSGNNGFGALTPQPGVLLDASAPQPMGPHWSVKIAHSQISNSSTGIIVNGQVVTVDDVTFTANTAYDAIFGDAHDSQLINSHADSATVPNVIEQPGATGDSFINNVVRGMSLQARTINHDNRAPTR